MLDLELIQVSLNVYRQSRGKGKIHILYSGRILYILSEYFERDDTVTAGDIMFNRGIILVDDWLTKASRPRDGFANTKDKL